MSLTSSKCWWCLPSAKWSKGHTNKLNNELYHDMKETNCYFYPPYKQ